MIPDFNEWGLLPPTPNGEPYVCTTAEIRNRFVRPFGVGSWRAVLFDAWIKVRSETAEIAPMATWWLWGCFVSNHEEPLFGDRESMSSLVIVPVADLTPDSPRLTMLVDFLQGAEERHRVDVGIVYDLDRAHPDYLSATVEALETKWRPRATKGVAEHSERTQVDAGFLEVEP